MKKILLLVALVLIGAYVYSQRRPSTTFKSVGNAEFARIIADTTVQLDRKSTRLNSSHFTTSRMPSSA